MNHPAVCPACGALPRHPCKRMVDETTDAQACLRVQANGGRIDTGRASTANGRVGAAEPPTGLYGQPAATAPAGPSWLLEPEPGGAARRDREVHLHPDETCEVKITISSRALDAIVADVAPVGDLVETGGILLGLRPKPGVVAITDAGGHGERAERKPMSYRHDALHDIQLAQQLGRWAGIEELGAWHNHRGSDRPSPRDLQAWAGMAELLSKYRQTNPHVGLIVTAPHLPGSVATGDWRHPRLSAWVTEPGSLTSSTPWYRCRRATIEVG